MKHTTNNIHACLTLRSWHKVKIKSADPAVPGATGLVPALYLTPVAPIRIVRALYDYAPAIGAGGLPENDEELEIAEGEELELVEEEPDWILVQRAGAQGAGFVPATYVEVSRSTQAVVTPD